MQGREVAVLADSEFNAGNYDVTFDASALASGVYICKFEAGETGSAAGRFTDIKKMVLLK